MSAVNAACASGRPVSQEHAEIIAPSNYTFLRSAFVRGVAALPGLGTPCEGDDCEARREAVAYTRGQHLCATCYLADLDARP